MIEDIKTSSGAIVFIGVFLNAFTEFSEFSDKKFVIAVNGLKPATQPPLV